MFPAEALAAALLARGIAVDLATDARAWRYGQAFPAGHTHIIPSATLASRNPLALMRTAALLGLGVAKAWRLFRKIRPDAVVGFGGYPTVPSVLAAAWLGVPTVIHEQNAVMGRANRLLAPRVQAIATSFPRLADKDPALAAKATHTGNPVRPAVLAAAQRAYAPPQPGEPFRLLVFGGSQGAHVMAGVVPAAAALLPLSLQNRLRVTQQAREEDRAQVEAAYAQTGVKAEIAPFFTDLPQRMAETHLIVSRSGASTVAELAVIGRPAVLVPFPHALDQDQLANASVLKEAEGAMLITQDRFTPDRLAAEIAELAAAPSRLVAMAQGAKSAGAADAAERLADLVLRTAGIDQKGHSLT